MIKKIQFIYSTFIGSQENDWANDVVLDADSNIDLVGIIGFANFPITNDALQSNLPIGSNFLTIFKKK